MSHSTFDRSHNYIDAAAPSTLTKIQADKTRPGIRGEFADCAQNDSEETHGGSEEKITSLPSVMSVLLTEFDINGDGYSED